MTTLSIIIPVYNVQDYLEICLQSLENQTIKNCYEVILVDDGSKDRSSSICDKYASNNEIFKVYHRQNAGASASRNFGIEHAHGKYITFVDSDDYVSENYVETIINNISDDLDLVYFSLAQFYEDGCVTHFHREPFEARETEDVENRLLSLKHNSQHIETFSFTVNKCFNRDVIMKNNIRFCDLLSTREDDIFTNDYCRYTKSVKYVDEILYYYRIGHSSLTRKHKSREELKLLAREMSRSTDWIKTKRLRDFQTNRIFGFYMDASYASMVPSVSLFREMSAYFKSNHPYHFDGRYKLIFNHNQILSLPIYGCFCALVNIVRSRKNRT